MVVGGSGGGRWQCSSPAPLRAVAAIMAVAGGRGGSPGGRSGSSGGGGGYTIYGGAGGGGGGGRRGWQRQRIFTCERGLSSARSGPRTGQAGRTGSSVQ